MEKTIIHVDHVTGLGTIITYDYSKYNTGEVVNSLKEIQETDILLLSGVINIEAHISIGKLLIIINEPKAKAEFGDQLPAVKKALLEDIENCLKKAELKK